MVAPRRNTVFRYRTRSGLFILQRQRGFNLLLQDAQHALIDKIVHQSRLMEPNFMLGGMDVNINLMRVDFKIKHKRRLLIRAKLILAGLTNGVVDQTVAHHTTIHVTILDLREGGTAGLRVGNPTAQGQIAVLPFNGQRLFQKRRTADSAQTTFFLPTFRYRTVLTHQLAIMAEVDGDIETRQRDTADNLIDMTEFGLLGAHKLTAGGSIVEEIQYFERRADRMRRRLDRNVHITPFGVGLPGFLLFGRTGGQR